MSPLHGYRARFEPDDVDPVADEPVVRPQGYGPCLYLGPQGQRCERPAIEGGFCAVHSGEAVSPGPWMWVRRLAAILVAAAILWPIIEALLEELSLWRH